ncbi:FAS1-like dehydratase domain-containing protein [Nocardia grenadensis]|uniref:FAS1-like dehydratase domain-containing protein n=1 Tax=Nocardia grenadensis TaxID=931537 RepID=UPI003D75A3FC
MIVEIELIMLSEEELRAVVGRELPGGEYVIEPYVDWLLRDVVEAERDVVTAHPLFAYVATARGKGIGWDDVFRICGATAADGPMFGEHELELTRPLRVGERITVRGHFDSAERKHGRKTGIFDIIGFRVTLHDESGRLVGTTRNSIVYPRREA